ncbi:MAG: prolyl oligopeptidase family serine peptidase, partial [Firmicutes bacterium]|nr:prolyl oligopeptidase family serine peptidase [Bacillota bacterium]
MTDHIFERVYVETPLDTDGDGRTDLIACYIKRPSNVPANGPIPVVLVASPYCMSCNEDLYNLHPVDGDLRIYPAQNITEDEITFDVDNALKGDLCCAFREVKGHTDQAPRVVQTFELEGEEAVHRHLLERGYGVIFTGGLGTRGSDGLVLTGSVEEIIAFRSVIDWLNGRARGFTDRESGIAIEASWCNGQVAMMGRSYLGTLAIGVAASAPEGLKTIIPEAGISNWYEYYRENGLARPALDWQGDDIDLLSQYCMSRMKDDDYEKIRENYDKALAKMATDCDRESGNYNRFWDERNYLNRIGAYKGSALIIQGLNDWNVKPSQAVNLYKKLRSQGNEVSMILHQGIHESIFYLKDSDALEILDDWLDHYLRGEADKKPDFKVRIESSSDQSIWYEEEDFAAGEGDFLQFPSTQTVYHGNVNASKEGCVNTAHIRDCIDETVYDRKADNRKAWLDQLMTYEPGDDRKLMIIQKAEEDIRISGVPEISFRASITGG